MGDPKKIRSKYRTPMHPWQKARLEAEKSLLNQYGLVNKKEIWKFDTKLKNFKDIAKKLVTMPAEQAEKEREKMFGKLKSYNLVAESTLDNVLGLQIEQILDRRLQTVVYKKGLAKSMKQARQMIVHRHIAVNGRVVTAPGYLVKVNEENSIEFYSKSPFTDETHPERAPQETKAEQPQEKQPEAKAQ